MAVSEMASFIFSIALYIFQWGATEMKWITPENARWLVYGSYFLFVTAIVLWVYHYVGFRKREVTTKQVVDELLTLGIFSDMPVNITRILYALRSKLEVGLSNEVTSNQDNLVLSQLNLRRIVQLEQRKVKIFGSDNARDEGYWILTELGRDVIRYLQANKQVLDKEGSQP